MNNLIVICILLASVNSLSDIRAGVNLVKIKDVSINVGNSDLEGPEDQRNGLSFEASLFNKDTNWSALFKYSSNSYFDKNRSYNVDDGRIFFGGTFSFELTDKIVFEPALGLVSGTVQLTSANFQAVESKSFLAIEGEARVRIYLMDELGMTVGYGLVVPTDNMYRMNYFEAGIFKDF